MSAKPTSLEVLMAVDDLCDRYVASYRRGESPRIADYLEIVDQAHRLKLLEELIVLELGLRGDRQLSSAEEILQQHVSLLPPDADIETLRSAIQRALTSLPPTRTYDPNPTSGWSPKNDRERDVPRIPGFEIERKVDEGGMGVVYEARQVSLNRRVALKLIRDLDDATPDHLERFRREARAIAELNDPHFVQIYESGEHAGQPYMALEFVDGGTLEELRRGEPQPEKFCAEIVETISRAMFKAHDIGLVHRDLKPHNVLMTRDGTPKIADFGLVKRRKQDDSQRTEDGRVMGTVSYMSREQSYGVEVDARTDIHALGGILYCLLTGRPPYLGATVYDTIQQLRNQEPFAPRQLRPGVSKDLDTICLKCLQKEPRKRYATALDLAEDLRRFLDGRPIVARPVGVIQRSWRWAKRNPLAATVAALVVAIAVISSLMSWRLEVANHNLKNETIAATNARNSAEAARKSEEAARKAKTKQYNELLQSQYISLYHADSLLRNNPIEVKIRKRLMELALKALERLRDPAEPTTLFDRDEAIGNQRLGDVFVVLGDRKQALARYDIVYDVTQRALGKEPDNPIHHRNLAVACDKQAAVLRRLGETLKCREKYEESLRERLQWETLWKPAPDDEEEESDRTGVKSKIAESYMRLGEVNLSLGDARTALGHFTNAQSRYRDLPKEWLTSRLDTMSTLEQFLGETHYQLGDVAEAERYLRRAEEKRVKLYKDRASDEVVDALSRTYLKLGDFYLIAGDLTQAWDRYRRAHAGYAKLLEADPESARNRAGMGDIEYRIGTLLLRAQAAGTTLEHVPSGNDPQTHFAESCRLREELAKIDSDDFQAKIEWAVALARCGRAAEAQAQAELLAAKGVAGAEAQADLAEKPVGNPRLLFQAACTFALGSQASDDAIRTGCHARAYEVLEQLIASGWKDRVMLRDDPDLDPIRKEPRFQELLARLPQPDKQDEDKGDK